MTLDELTKPLTADEVRAAIYASLATRGVSTTTWKEGGVVRSIIAGVAIVIAAMSSLQALVAKSGFLELAEQDWLTLVARYVYGVERDLGTFATGTITLNNGGGGVYSGAPGDLIVANAAGKQYRNTASFSIAALQTGVVVPVRAVELGSASSTAANTITQFVTPLLLVEVDGNTALVGTDPESDATLRLRCNEKTGVASPNGPRDAYAFIARSTKRADGSSIGVTRVRSIPDGVGGIDVYVATAGGIVTSPDIALIAAAIQQRAEPLAITARVSSATLLSVAVTYELWVRATSGYSAADIEDLVTAKLTEFFSGQPIGGLVIPPAGGRIYVSAIESVIGSILPGLEVRVAVSVPAADVVVGSTEAPVLAGTPMATIHLVDAGGA